MTEKVQSLEGAPIIDPTKQALEMTEWFPDYMFGSIEEPGALPQMTRSRLRRHFGDDMEAGLRLVCDEIPMMDPDMQPDIAAYICGFPKSDLEAMLENEIGKVLLALDRVFPPIKKYHASAFSPHAIPTQNYNKPRSISMSTYPEPEQPRIMPWSSDSLCAQTDPEAFFPDKGGSTRDAKRICMDCSTRQECLVDALERDERFGIWGGLSERERRAVLSKNEKLGRPLTIEEVAENAITEQIEKAKRAAKKAKDDAYKKRNGERSQKAS